MINLAIEMFNLPNILTASNLLCGVLAIFMALSGQLEVACVLIYIAAILDFFDGFLARKLNQMSELGKQLDSLADMVTFGVAPGVLVTILLIVASEGGVYILNDISFSEMVYSRIHAFSNHLSKGEWSEISWWPFFGLVIPFFSLFRLAKFNIDTRQSESFIGLPTPANTIFFTAIPLLMAKYYYLDESNAVLDFILTPWVLIVIAVGMSLLLVAELPLFSLKFKNFKLKGNEIKFVFLASCLVMIPLLQAWSIPLIILLYIGLSVLQNVTNKSATTN